MCQYLCDSGYGVWEVLFDGKLFGVLESCMRWFLVVVIMGINIDFDLLELICVLVCMIVEVLENVSDDDLVWRSFDYFKVKEVCDVVKGNGFVMQIVYFDDVFVLVFCKGYYKGGFIDLLFVYLMCVGIYCFFMVVEYVCIKQIVEYFILDMFQIKVYELFGQSVLVVLVKVLFNRIGYVVCNWV